MKCNGPGALCMFETRKYKEVRPGRRDSQRTALCNQEVRHAGEECVYVSFPFLHLSDRFAYEFGLILIQKWTWSSRTLFTQICF